MKVSELMNRLERLGHNRKVVVYFAGRAYEVVGADTSGTADEGEARLLLKDLDGRPTTETPISPEAPADGI